MGRSPNAATSGASGRRGSPWRAAGLLLVALLILAGLSMIFESLTLTQARPPQPATVPEIQIPDRPAGAVAGMPRSEPTEIRIPRIGVNAQVMNVGVNPEGKIEVPAPEQAHLAAWYERGPSPGETGNAVVVGHVDSYVTGPAVFFQLGALRPGDEIEIERRDGEVARFRVDRVESHPKETFPGDAVYGPADRPQLRLVTCGGIFDDAIDDYPNNVVVFASAVTAAGEEVASTGGGGEPARIEPADEPELLERLLT